MSLGFMHVEVDKKLIFICVRHRASDTTFCACKCIENTDFGTHYDFSLEDHSQSEDKPNKTNDDSLRLLDSLRLCCYLNK